MIKERDLLFLNNQNLFSNNYLACHLPIASIWASQIDKAKDVFIKIKAAYENIKSLNPGPGQEADLEDKFIRPVLKALDFEYHVQPREERSMKKQKRPDYALFKDLESYKEASAFKNDPKKFFSYALTILEAKYWNRRLNDTDKMDILDSSDPTAQTVKYLDDIYYHTNGKINWAILTNGKHWRLFYYRASSRSGNFYEVDLEEIISRNNIEDFLYFYLFFSRDAFVPDETAAKTWLDQHLAESEAYAKTISDKLKDIVFDQVFEGLAEGFVFYRRTELCIMSETDESLKEIFKGCLTFLYRLLFILYAESRKLLPLEHERYHRYSLKKLKEDIYGELLKSGFDRMSKKSYTYWPKIKNLFRIVAEGDAELNVPVYNGGLFETPKDSFLDKHQIPDPVLAKAIELLTVDHTNKNAIDRVPFIDYSSLSVRHLGDIYEGLLEFYIQIAEEDIVEVKESNKPVWKKLADIKSGTKFYNKKAKGDVYIENSKHERKATGSYYTPHYIVEYIVANAIGSVLKNRLDKANSLLEELDELYARQRRQLKKSIEWKHWEHPGEPMGDNANDIVRKEKEIIEAVFDIKVLDPAMGSGHFLVHTVDYITDNIISFLALYPINPVIRRMHEMRDQILNDLSNQGIKIDESKLTEVNLIKRMVMKRCIYGVDLNEMAVELAKLSLWLDSFTLGAPLSFLDHHLKCGNSLIGSSIALLEQGLKEQIFAINLEPLKRAIQNIIFISELPDATIAQARESKNKYGEVNRGLEGYKFLLDMLIADYFGISEAKKMLIVDAGKINLEKLQASIDALPENDKNIIQQIRALAHEKSFFHWEIEFPEVFYERISEFIPEIHKKENPGFDCIIANPPYIQLSMDESIRNTMQSYLLNRFLFSMGRLNTFGFFTKLGIELSKYFGKISMIVPNTFLTMPYYADLREYILNSAKIESLLIFDSLPFEDVIVENAVYVFQKIMNQNELFDNKVEIHEAASILNGIHSPIRLIPQRQFQNLYEKTFNPYLTDQLIDLLEKLKSNTSLLKEFVDINQAIALKHNRSKYLTKTSIGDKYKKVLDGRDIDRYSLNFSGYYLKYDKDAIHSCKREDIF